MIVHYAKNDLPSDIDTQPGMQRYWSATDPQLEAWANREESWFIRFVDAQSALVFLLRYPDVATPCKMPAHWLDE